MQSLLYQKSRKKLQVRGDFDASKTYKVNILSGVRAIDGSSTTDAVTEDIYFKIKKPKLAFTMTESYFHQ